MRLQIVKLKMFIVIYVSKINHVVRNSTNCELIENTTVFFGKKSNSINFVTLYLYIISCSCGFQSFLTILHSKNNFKNYSLVKYHRFRSRHLKVLIIILLLLLVFFFLISTYGQCLYMFHV